MLSSCLDPLDWMPFAYCTMSRAVVLKDCRSSRTMMTVLVEGEDFVMTNLLINVSRLALLSQARYLGLASSCITQIVASRKMVDEEMKK